MSGWNPARRRLPPLVVTFLAAVCGCDSGAAPSSSNVAGSAPGPDTAAEPAGAAGPAQKLGQRLTGADSVAVADLLRNPKAYEGKTVRVTGPVEDFCHHRRAWFAVSAAGGKGMVRIFTSPKFLVPADCKGKQGTAEGIAEIITISPEQVEHFGKEHKFLEGLEIQDGQPVLSPVVRAYGAEFR